MQDTPFRFYLRVFTPFFFFSSAMGLAYAVSAQALASDDPSTAAALNVPLVDGRPDWSMIAAEFLTAYILPSLGALLGVLLLYATHAIRAYFEARFKVESDTLINNIVHAGVSYAEQIASKEAKKGRVIHGFDKMSEARRYCEKQFRLKKIKVGSSELEDRIESELGRRAT